MLADTSISRAGVRKAKPQRAARLAIGANTCRPAATEGGLQVAAAAWHTGRAGRLVRSCRYQNRAHGRQCRRSSRRTVGGWRGLVPSARRQGEGGELGRRCESGRGDVSGICASVSGGRRRGRAHRRRETAMRTCRGGASRRGGAVHRRRAARRRGASCRGGARQGRARRGEARQRFGGKRVSADLEGDWAYIEPPTFCHGSCSQP
jgi:hypothetical protein